MKFSQTQKPPLGSQINRSHPLAKGLVGCWLMNERSGDQIYDLSGNRHHGKFTNNPVFSGNSLLFGGVNEYVTIPSIKWTMVAPHTFSIVFTLYPFVLANYNQKIGTGDWNAFLFHTTSVGLVRCGINFAQRFGPELPAGTLVANKWHHIAYVLDNTGTTGDGGSHSFYKNGRLLAKKDTTRVGTIAWDGLVLGADYNLTGDPDTINGCMNSLMLYDRSLSAMEVVQLYQSPYVLFEHRPNWRSLFENRRRIQLICGVRK